MNFDFTPEQLAIKKMITSFVNSEIKPYADDADKLEIFPAEQLSKLAKLGVMGMSIPEKYGGSELDNVSQTIIMEEVSRGCSAAAVSMGAHSSLTCHPIVNFGLSN